MTWLRNTFGNERCLETLRQAKKIAMMGEYAIKYAELGQSRVLELYYLFVQMINEEEDIRFRDKTFTGFTEIEKQKIRSELSALEQRYQFSMEAELNSFDVTGMRTNMDALITIWRLSKHRIDETICSYELAKMLALYRGYALEVKHVIKIENMLAGIADSAKKTSTFNDWVKNRMLLPDDERIKRPLRMRSILSYMSDWNSKKKDVKARDIEILMNDPTIQDSITDAYRIVVYLAHKTKTRLEEPATIIRQQRASLNLNDN